METNPSLRVRSEPSSKVKAKGELKPSSDRQRGRTRGSGGRVGPCTGHSQRASRSRPPRQGGVGGTMRARLSVKDVTARLGWPVSPPSGPVEVSICDVSSRCPRVQR